MPKLSLIGSFPRLVAGVNVVDANLQYKPLNKDRNQAAEPNTPEIIDAMAL
jgi:hypothetical protein